jgi:glucoamylase
MSLLLPARRKELIVDPSDGEAPGKPGSAPTWTSGAKMGVGTALSAASSCWFTLGQGIINEVYYPRLDQANLRDLQFLITRGNDFFAEERHDTRHEVMYIEKGVPAYRVLNLCKNGNYRIEKYLLSDPLRPVMLLRVKFSALRGKLGDYRLFVLANPHMANHGSDNCAWTGDYKGVPMLYASRGNVTLALACSRPWRQRSVGYVGVSDGWQDVSRHYEMRWHYARAEGGNVALAGEIDLGESGEFVLALGFGSNDAEAGQRARYSAENDFQQTYREYAAPWEAWQQTLAPLDDSTPGHLDLYRTSTAVLRMHESPNFPGGMIASLSIPWGAARGDEDIGGYHMVWSRDLSEGTGGILAAGGHKRARQGVIYLRVTQEPDGHWPQLMWLDGRRYWEGIQMDEAALPVLLLNLALREKAIGDHEAPAFWSMVKRAVGYLLRRGPSSPQDRWENTPGFSPFTLATEIAALVVAAALAERVGESAAGKYLRETADLWNACIECWTYVTGTELAQRCGVEGYYVRIAPPELAGRLAPPGSGTAAGNAALGSAPAGQVVSPDALALVRFGLRAADDARILNTIRVIDQTLKTELPAGPGWHRYTHDEYGETTEGDPFCLTDRQRCHGRLWPLLTGERAHYELAAGHVREAQRLMHVMDAFASDGLLPEQIWDSPDIPAKGLRRGKPTGSAMPLVWAHAEYVKLRRSLQDGKVFDLPPEVQQRYVKQEHRPAMAVWRFEHPLETMPAGLMLRLEVFAAARVRYSIDGWKTAKELETRDTGLGVFVADLSPRHLPGGTEVAFTFFWVEAGTWEGKNFTVTVEGEETKVEGKSH